MNSRLLKKACVIRWNMPADPAADAEGQHHVAKLADGRISEHAFDVGGGDGDRRGHEERDRADDGDDQQHFRREHRIEPADQINAGGDHRRRVHERADGRGAFHRIGQPGMQRKLSTLADAAAEDADARDDQQPVAVAFFAATRFRSAFRRRFVVVIHADPQPAPVAALLDHAVGNTAIRTEYRFSRADVTAEFRATMLPSSSLSMSPKVNVPRRPRSGPSGR